MKGKKKLEKAIVMGVMLSSIAVPVWAYEDVENIDGKGELINLITSDNGEGAQITKEQNFSSLTVTVTGVDEKYNNVSGAGDKLGDTTTALVIKNNVTVTGPVKIINTASNDADLIESGNQAVIDNNNALYVDGGYTVTFGRENSNDNIFIYALDGNEKRSSAISVRGNSTVDIKGNNVQLIGNIDFLNEAGKTGNRADLNLNTVNSYWYGNEGQAAKPEQLSGLVDLVSDDVVAAVIKIKPELSISQSSLKDTCSEKLNKYIHSILNSFGGGNLNLTLKNGAEWVYDSNGKTEIEFETDELVKKIPDSMLEEMLKSAGVSDENEIGKLINVGKLFLSTKLIQEYGATLPVTIQSEVSKISAITLDGGVVNLNDDYIKHKYADYIIADGEEYIKHQKVTIGELKGKGGIFKVDLDWSTNKGTDGLGQKKETENSDYIYIEKMDAKANGNSTQVIDFDASKAHLDQMKIGKDRLYFANVADSGTDFVTVNGTKQAVSSGAGNIFSYEYRVGSEENKVTNSIAKDNTTENTATQPDGTEFYIEVTGKSAEGNANFESAKGAMYAGYALGTELDTLNKRMGEARYLEDDNGVWVRYRHAKTGWDDTFKTNSDMFQLGFDKQVQEDDGTHYRGVAVDYTDADTSLMHASGDGENKRYAVSLYDTWIGEKGHYRDLVLRGGRINSDYDISGMFDNGMADIGGDYHQWFGSISAEWGRKNDMQSGWYFEPQVQAQLARIGGASYVSDSGVDVDQDGATSLIGRAGFRLGREYEKDNGKTDNYYFKADLMHEFMGDKGIALSTATERYTDEYDGQETWFDIGLGADISIGKNSYFWADVERTFGADFDNTWQINGGFRWEF